MVGDRFSSSVQFCILYLKLGMDFPLTSRILSESSVFGSSVVAKRDFFFFMLEFGSKSWEEKLKYRLQCTNPRFAYFSLTMSISVKLVRELRRIK